MEQHTCANCGNTFTDEFCNHCGQKTAHRITIKHIFHDIAHAFTHADKGIINLFLQLFVRPGVVAREYIVEGKRKKYFNPFQYILILGSIAVFVAVNSHFMETTMEVVGGPATDFSARQREFMHTVSNYQTKYFNLMILLQLPFFALGSYWVYRKYKFNYAEHLTLHTFLTAQTTLVSMITMFFIAVSGRPGVYIGGFIAILSAIYQVFAFTQFFREKSFKGVLRGIAAYLIGFAVSSLLMILIVAVLAVIIVSHYKK
ncbi:MAG: DUF3667 domain-containing protein [Chitinophagaceae bacterium]